MSKRSPWIFIPTLYFAQGLPYTIVNLVSTIYLKDLGASNELIGMTSALQAPWVLKFAWAPLVDFFSYKKRWIVVAQIVLAAFLAALAVTTISPSPIAIGIAVMGLIALASATHDASIDGYYLEVLNKSDQALFVGVRNTAYRLSWIFGTGVLVYMAGELTKPFGKQYAWLSAFAISAIVFLLLFLLHTWYLPRGSATEQEDVAPAEKAQSGLSRNYLLAILSYFDQPGALAIVFYILTFRLGDALVMKMIPPFLQDPIVKGGLGLSVQQIGIIYGTVGVGCLLLGGIIGGYVVSKQGLKKWFWPATLLMDSTILLYWLLSTFRPSEIVWVFVVNSLEQFGYGFGMAVYTVFMLSTVKQEYKAAHYAVATALMALGVMGPSMVSGYVCNAAGYANFFLLSFFLTIPGIISIFFLPIWRKENGNTVY